MSTIVKSRHNLLCVGSAIGRMLTSEEISDGDPSSELLALLLATIAGIGATSLGAAMVFCLPQDSTRPLAIAMSSSAGVLMYVAVAELFPVSIGYFSQRPSIEKWSSLYAACSVILGVVISVLLEAFVNFVWPTGDEGVPAIVANKSIESLQTDDSSSEYSARKLRRISTVEVIVAPPPEDDLPPPPLPPVMAVSNSLLAPPPLYTTQDIYDIGHAKAYMPHAAQPLSRRMNTPPGSVYSSRKISPVPTNATPSEAQSGEGGYGSGAGDHVPNIHDSEATPRSKTRRRMNSRDGVTPIVQPLTPRSFESFTHQQHDSGSMHVESHDHPTQYFIEGYQTTIRRTRISSTDEIEFPKQVSLPAFDHTRFESEERQRQQMEAGSNIDSSANGHEEPRKQTSWLTKMTSMFRVQPHATFRDESSSQVATTEKTERQSASQVVSDRSSSSGSSNTSRVNYDQHSMRDGIISCLLLGLHNLPEGLATFSAALESPSFGFSIAIAIALHNVPEGIVVAAPIYVATGNKCQAFFWGAIPGLAEPLGALIGWAILASSSGGDTAVSLGIMYGAVCGILVHVCIKKLIPIMIRIDPEDKWFTTWLMGGFLFIMLIMGGVSAL